MKIKTKLTYGIGILFILILILGVVAGKYITDMSTDTRNILADNYQSLSYARQMLYSLENIGKDTAAVNVFIDNLRKQQNNITEKDEAEVTTRLMMHFEQFKKDTGQLVVRQLRQDLNDIIQVNMHSIYHKSEIAGRTATNALDLCRGHRLCGDRFRDSNGFPGVYHSSYPGIDGWDCGDF